MAHIRDQWTRPVKNPDGSYARDEDGEKLREKDPERWGKGLRYLVIYQRPDKSEASVAVRTKTEAVEVRDAFTVDIRRGDWVDPRAGQMLFDDLADDWLGLQTVGANSMRRYRLGVKYLKKTFSGQEIGAIRPSAARAWYKQRYAVVPDSANFELWLLDRILQTAVDDELIRKSPAAKVAQKPGSRRTGKKKVNAWPLETIEGIIRAVPEPVRTLPALGFAAGLRPMEASAVAVDDIDWLRRVLHVRRQVIYFDGRKFFAEPKDESAGDVPLEPAVVEWLAAHVARHPPVDVTLPWLPGDPADADLELLRRPDLKMVTVKLLCTLRGYRTSDPRTAVIPNPYYRGYWRPALAVVGLLAYPPGDRRKSALRATKKGDGPHHLRHDYATYQIYAGHSPLAVSGWLRHANPAEIFKTYAHSIKDSETTTIEDPIGTVFRSLSAPSDAANYGSAP